MAGFDGGRKWALAVCLAALVAGGMLQLTVTPAEAACCSCSGSCGAGFCVDEVATTLACQTICINAGCNVISNNVADVCDGGCGVIGPQQTATSTNGPSRTPSETPTPTATLPTATATSSTTPTATITATGSVTATATNTPIPPTPVQCCECTGTSSCGAPSTPGVCLPGCSLRVDASCDSRAGGSNLCLTNTITPTVTQTRTITPTFTLTPTITSTPTVTNTPTATNTPLIPTNIDPYKCYRVKAQDRIPSRTVTVQDQFERKLTVVLKPFLICNPSVRFVAPTAVPNTPAGTPPTAGPSPTPTATPTLALKNPADHLVCYKVKDDNKAGSQPKFAGKKVKIRNEVLPDTEKEESYEVLKSDLVCLPSTKIVLP